MAFLGPNWYISPPTISLTGDLIIPGETGHESISASTSEQTYYDTKRQYVDKITRRIIKKFANLGMAPWEGLGFKNGPFAGRVFGYKWCLIMFRYGLLA